MSKSQQEGENKNRFRPPRTSDVGVTRQIIQYNYVGTFKEKQIK